MNTWQGLRFAESELSYRVAFCLLLLAWLGARSIDMRRHRVTHEDALETTTVTTVVATRASRGLPGGQPSPRWRPLVIPQPPAPCDAGQHTRTLHPVDDAERQPESNCSRRSRWRPWLELLKRSFDALGLVWMNRRNRSLPTRKICEPPRLASQRSPETPTCAYNPPAATSCRRRTHSGP